MYIRASQGISNKNDKFGINASERKFRTVSGIHCNNDIFTPSRKQSKQVSFGGIFDFLFSIFGPDKPGLPDENDPSLSFAQKLSIGLNKEWGDDIPPEDLKNVWSSKELRKYLNKVKTENFISSKKNQRNGTYNTDLDYVTSFSYNGEESIYDVLTDAAKYANELYSNTGKNFVFAVTDNDTTQGLKYAIRLIGNNPEKFRHLMFVPGVRMSFAYRVSDTQCENNSLLVYGINPFSENVDRYILNNLLKRKNMIFEFIHNVSKVYGDSHFNEREFLRKNNIYLDKDFGQANLYLRIKEYINSKSDAEISGLNLTPKEIYQFSDEIFHGVDLRYSGSENYEKYGQRIASIKDSDGFLARYLFDKYSAKYDREKDEIVSDSENIFSDFIDCMKQETPAPIMALANPYYFVPYFEQKGTKQFPNMIKFIQSLQKYSHGMIIGFESVSPLYKSDKELRKHKESIEDFNAYIKANTTLKEVGGSFARREGEISNSDDDTD